MRKPHVPITKDLMWIRFFGASIVIVLASLSIGSVLLSCQKPEPSPLTVWTYDSFISEWGPAQALADLWKEKTGLTVEFVSKGDGGALLGAVMSQGTTGTVDVVIGLDDRLADSAIASGLFREMDISNLSKVDELLKVDAKNRLVPYDYGNFAIIWDSEAFDNPPTSLEDLTNPRFAKKLILMDPRTSTPGLGFLAWTESIYGDMWEDYWKRLAPSILAMTPGWDTGYGLFTKGEAPLVLSYSTSPAYHKAYENTERYKTLVFTEGHTAQIELAGILKRSKRFKEAEKFIDFLLSSEAQSILPETQWMYPVNGETALPESFSIVPKNIKTISSHLRNPAKDPETAVSIVTSSF